MLKDLKMKVMLIAVPNVLKDSYKKDSFANRMTPIDLAIIGAVIEKKHKVKILDALALGLDKSQILKEIKKFNPDIICLSAFDRCRWAIDSANEISKSIQKGKVGLIWSYKPEILKKIMNDNKDLDFSIYGDPEYALLEIADKNKFSGVKGVIYRKKEEIIENKPRELIKNLDELPFPARHLLNMEVYKRFPHEMIKAPSYDMFISKGCPFSCTYCIVSINSGKIRRVRSPQKVVDEMKYLKKLGAKQIHFGDPVFTANKKWILNFCNLIIKERLKIVWSCQTRTDTVDEGVLIAMKKAGCVSILYGIESFYQKSLDIIKKGSIVKDMIEKIKLTKKIGIESRCSMMIGLPGETKESLLNNVNQLIKINPAFAQFHSVVAFPGTELYEQANIYGKILEDGIIRKFDINGKAFIPKGYENEEEVIKMQRKAYRKFYFRPSYILKKLINIKELPRNIKGLAIFLRLDK